MLQWKQYRTKISPLPQVKDLVEEKTCKLADTQDFCALESRFFAQAFMFHVNPIDRMCSSSQFGCKWFLLCIQLYLNIYTYYIYVDCNTRTLKQQKNKHLQYLGKSIPQSGDISGLTTSTTVGCFHRRYDLVLPFAFVICQAASFLRSN